jgi:hypothetical protein
VGWAWGDRVLAVCAAGKRLSCLGLAPLRPILPHPLADSLPLGRSHLPAATTRNSGGSACDLFLMVHDYLRATTMSCPTTLPQLRERPVDRLPLLVQLHQPRFYATAGVRFQVKCRQSFLQDGNTPCLRGPSSIHWLGKVEVGGRAGFSSIQKLKIGGSIKYLR